MLKIVNKTLYVTPQKYHIEIIYMNLKLYQRNNYISRKFRDIANNVFSYLVSETNLSTKRENIFFSTYILLVLIHTCP